MRFLSKTSPYMKKPYGFSAVRFLFFILCEDGQGTGCDDEYYNKYGDVKRGGRE